jgi:hypothetical protein
MNQQLTVYEKMADPLQAIKELGTVIAKSGMFGADTESKGQIIALTCFTERISPVEFQRRYHLVEGKLAMRADRMLAGFRAAGGKCQWLSDIQSTQEAAACFSYKENERVTLKYTIEDATREGLTAKKVWQRSAPDMLRARLISKAIRMLAPEIVCGSYTEEEIQAGVTEENALQAEILPGPLAPLLPTDAQPLNAQDAEELRQAVNDSKTLKEICEGLEPTVNDFLAKKGWIAEGQTWRDLKPEHEKRIIERHPAFTAKIKEWAASYSQPQ